MSSANPPTYNFNGINFNPSFYTSSASSSINSALYVTTNTAQTVSGQKTFSTGQVFSNGFTVSGGTLTLPANSIDASAVTGLSTNYVDMSSTQSNIGGAKTFTGNDTFSGGLTNTSSATTMTNLILKNNCGGTYTEYGSLGYYNNNNAKSQVYLSAGTYFDGTNWKQSSNTGTAWYIDLGNNTDKLEVGRFTGGTGIGNNLSTNTLPLQLDSNGNLSVLGTVNGYTLSNFVDKSTTQTVAGDKTFTGNDTFSGGLTNTSSATNMTNLFLKNTYGGTYTEFGSLGYYSPNNAKSNVFLSAGMWFDGANWKQSSNTGTAWLLDTGNVNDKFEISRFSGGTGIGNNISTSTVPLQLDSAGNLTVLGTVNGVTMSNVVDKSSTQTITGLKTFSGSNINFTGSQSMANVYFHSTYGGTYDEFSTLGVYSPNNGKSVLYLCANCYYDSANWKQSSNTGIAWICDFGNLNDAFYITRFSGGSGMGGTFTTVKDMLTLDNAGNLYVAGNITSAGTTGTQQFSKVGINGAPSCCLDIFTGGTYVSITATGYSFAQTNSSLVSLNNQSVLARINGNIGCGGAFWAYSDRRIKNILEEEFDDLHLIEQIDVVRFRYKDHNKGTNVKIGFIAQEVRKVIPEAVTFDKNYIPDVMTMIEKIDGTKLTLSNHSLVENDKIKLYDAENKEHIVNVISVISPDEFEIDEDLKQKVLFLFGREVEDLHMLDYDSVYSLAFSGVKKLIKENRELKDKVNKMSAFLQSKFPDFNL